MAQIRNSDYLLERIADLQTELRQSDPSALAERTGADFAIAAVEGAWPAEVFADDSLCVAFTRALRVTAPPADVVYLFQQYSKSLFPWLTVEANVMFGLRQRAANGDARARCRHYLDMVGLAGFAAHYPWQLSGGMQQRVAIARALAAEPRALLMDEPFSSVDALTRLDLQALILDLWTKNRLTVMLVTHDVDEAVFLADRVAVLTHRPGVISEIVQTGLPRPRDAVVTREDPRFLKVRHHLLEKLLARPDDVRR